MSPSHTMTLSRDDDEPSSMSMSMSIGRSEGELLSPNSPVTDGDNVEDLDEEDEDEDEDGVDSDDALASRDRFMTTAKGVELTLARPRRVASVGAAEKSHRDFAAVKEEDSEVVRKFKKAKQTVVLNKDTTDGFADISCTHMIRHKGVRTILVEASWAKLNVLLGAYYLLAGGCIGLVLWAAGEYDDHDEFDQGTWYDWWLRGVFLLLANVIWYPAGALETSIAALSAFVGAVVTLLLFGVVYEKFASRRNPTVFADRIMLRRLPEELGGYAMLSFRYANLRGDNLLNAKASAMTLKRYVMPDGDGIFVQQPLSFDFVFRGTTDTGALGDVNNDLDACTLVPPAFFLHHVIDERSPFYCEDNTSARCCFTGFPRIFVTISGLTHNQELQVGNADWGPAAISVNGVFCSMKPRADDQSFNFKEFNTFKPLAGVARFKADVTRESLGLPAEPPQGLAV